jgi:hypothetical protein
MADEAAHRDHVDPDARSAAPNDHTHDTSHARAELAPANRYPHTYSEPQCGVVLRRTGCRWLRTS